MSSVFYTVNILIGGHETLIFYCDRCTILESEPIPLLFDQLARAKLRAANNSQAQQVSALCFKKINNSEIVQTLTFDDLGSDFFSWKKLTLLFSLDTLN